MTEYFNGIGRIPYERPDSKNLLAFKYYDAEQMVAGKKMKDHLRFAMSYWHTLTGGGVDPPSCPPCPPADPQPAGQTRVGKPIDPMAASANAARFTDLAKVEKWILRNCNSVLGRECTPQETGDVISWLMTQ